MKLVRYLATSLLVCWLITPALSESRAEKSSRSTGRRIDPQALEILKRMSTTLGAAKAFTFHSRSVIEVPIRTGQFITLFSSAEVSLKRPDKLRARLSGEAPHFDFYFDGTTASAFAPKDKVYSSTKAPPTVDTMLPELQQETGIRFVLAPLLFTDPVRSAYTKADQRGCGRECRGQWNCVLPFGVSIAWRKLGNLGRGGKACSALAPCGDFHRSNEFSTDLGRIYAVEPSSMAELSSLCLFQTSWRTGNPIRHRDPAAVSLTEAIRIR